LPLAEIDALAAHWQNYVGLRDRLFVPRDAAYATHEDTPQFDATTTDPVVSY